MCSFSADFCFNYLNRKYFYCRNCSALFLSPANYILPEKEKKRYLEHNNDVNDSGYQKFVGPIITKVEEKFSKKAKGLDFGAGTGPVAAKLLRDKGYSIKLYDPFFWNNPQVLKKKYDFIICCETIEHFHFPAKEFKLLKSLLKPKGILFCMTDLYSEEINFKKWYYKNDPTHVFFYHKSTFCWIKSKIGFSALDIEERLVQLFL
ncbi:MAG: class I SAM-dependent methyltransferase [Candidatus Omnitrophica bacterium]|nr:class I SAM-dependent methyltransferase [Candidatus Omnitrophota bacterium]